MSILCQKVKEKFDYTLFDGSYILTRRAMAMSHYNLKDITFGNMLTETIEMIYKFLDTNFNSSHVYILWDKWDPEIKGYYRTRDLSDYKGNRYYHNEDDLDKLKQSGATDKEIEDYQKMLLINTTKQKVKKFIIDEFSNYGIPSIAYPGYEADDIAKCFCDIYKYDSNVAIVSKDSDWKFLIGDKAIYVDLLDGKRYTESDVRSQEHIDPRIPIYTFKCLLDSLYGSHNNLQVTVDKKKVNYKIKKYDAVTRTFDGDRSLILEDKLDLFKTNVESFRIKSFPKYSELEETIKQVVNYVGYTFKNEEAFIKDMAEKSINLKVTDYSNFIQSLW